MNAVLQSPREARAIVHRTRGQTHGPITRLFSPSDLGELIKPFVFLDLFKIPASGEPLFGWHPHSGIATLTLVQEGATSYEETTGQKGVLRAGGVEWMRAGRGVWHTGSSVGAEATKGFQLWIALPEPLELASSQSRYLSAEEVPMAGNARVILGTHGETSSVIPAPPGINYLDVQLKAGEIWRYRPPAGHEVAWLAVSQGAVRVGEPVSGPPSNTLIPSCWAATPCIPQRKRCTLVSKRSYASAASWLPRESFANSAFVSTKELP
jgi:redox-sensitive bicupin YhaK (pirin superfamily)